jgi:hypothetical protein
VQRGTELLGKADQDYAGVSCDISNNGNTIIVGAYKNSGNGSDAGHARIYHWNGMAWVQKGTTIADAFFFDAAGTSVNISDDGSIVAIGAVGGNNCGSRCGSVQFHAWLTDI